MLLVVSLLQGCSAPLVVKVADSERDKNARRIQNTLASMGVGVNGMGQLGLQAAAYYQVRMPRGYW